MRRVGNLAFFVLFVTGCGPTTTDRVNQVPGGASRDEVIAILGAPLPEAEWPHANRLPEGCTSQLVYKDEYVRAYARALSSKLNSCGGIWLHLCFDVKGKYVHGRSITTMIQC